MGSGVQPRFSSVPQSETTGIRVREKVTQCESSSVIKELNGKLLMSDPTMYFSFDFKNVNVYSKKYFPETPP